MGKPNILKKRHIAKTITWRIVGSIDTLILAAFFTNSLETGGWIAFTEIITKIFLYYFNERAWCLYNWKSRNRKRHFLKTISWRFIGTLDTLLLSWIFTLNPFIGLKIITGELITKMLLYYFHERVWRRFNFGVIKDEN